MSTVYRIKATTGAVKGNYWHSTNGWDDIGQIFVTRCGAERKLNKHWQRHTIAKWGGIIVETKLEDK
jgi:hypothetical protein